MIGPVAGRLLIWEGIDAWRTEVAVLDLSAAGLRASGTQIGSEPLAYRLDYTLDATDDWVTRSLDVEVTCESWRRRLGLRREPSGSWTCETEQHGDASLPEAGGEPAGLAGALDCDLGLSPLPGTPRSLRPWPTRFSLANPRPNLRREGLSSAL